MILTGAILAAAGLAVAAVSVFLQSSARKRAKSTVPGYVCAAAGVVLLVAGVMCWLV